jgi:hypothetical protein
VECTDAICVDGKPANPPSMDGTPCVHPGNPSGGGLCISQGCVACYYSPDCGQPGYTCAGYVCHSCTDGVQNGTETDVDCGLECPNGCSTGQKCKQNFDCASNQCNNGTCG